MNAEYIITVQDVIQRPLFGKARLVAGHGGLHRKIRWAHVLEVSDFDSLLHGEEMILSTGIGIHTLPLKQYLERLIKSNVSCLCIELGSYISTISEEVIELANEHDFPLIVFYEIVRFVDITQDLNSLVINQHHKMLESLEKISREFNRLTLSSSGTIHILRLLHQSTDLQVAFLPIQGTPQFVPALPAAEQMKIIDSFKYRQASAEDVKQEKATFQWKEENTIFLTQPVGAMGQIWASLVLLIKDREPADFDLLVIDHATIAVSQDLLRKRYMDERRLHKENLWVDDLIHNRLKTEEQMMSMIGPKFHDHTELLFRVCVLEVKKASTYSEEIMEEEFEAIRLHAALLVRSSFEQYSFHPLLTTKGNQIIVVAIDISSKKNHKQRLKQLFEKLDSQSADPNASKFKLTFGIGRLYKRFTEASISYNEAQKVLRILHVIPHVKGSFYEDIGIYRLLLHLESDTDAAAFIKDYLGPVIEYDKSKGIELIRTLKVYFDNQGSKQASAQQLFLTRQALYHRLNKIQELLGEDIESPEKRLSIEVALRAYELFFPESFT